MFKTFHCVAAETSYVGLPPRSHQSAWVRRAGTNSSCLVWRSVSQSTLLWVNNVFKKLTFQEIIFDFAVNNFWECTSRLYAHAGFMIVKGVSMVLTLSFVRWAWSHVEWLCRAITSSCLPSGSLRGKTPTVSTNTTNSKWLWLISIKYPGTYLESLEKLNQSIGTWHPLRWRQEWLSSWLVGKFAWKSLKFTYFNKSVDWTGP